MGKKKNISPSVLASKLKNYTTQEDEHIAEIFSKLELPSALPYYDGIYSIVHPGENHGGFSFTEETLKPGYFASTRHTTLNLIDNKRKLLVSLSNSVYHFLAEDVANILRILEEGYEDLELIVDISGVEENIFDRDDLDMYRFFLHTLTHKGVKHRIINLRRPDIVYIDNFFLLTSSWTEFQRFNNIYDYFLDYVKDKTVAPEKKVFLSRKKVPSVKDEVYTDEYGVEQHASVDRIDDEQALEAMFKKLGFSVVYPEDFGTFDEQINFFYSVKTVASLTSSGLSNAIFMQPGGTMVEIITPLTVRPVKQDGTMGFLNREMHNYYKNLATTKNHLYIGIPNPYGKIDLLHDFLDRNSNIRKILKTIK